MTPSTLAIEEAATADLTDANRLRPLAQRYRIRADSTILLLADVLFDLRSRHGLQLSMAQVIALLSGKAAQ